MARCASIGGKCFAIDVEAETVDQAVFLMVEIEFGKMVVTEELLDYINPVAPPMPSMCAIQTFARYTFVYELCNGFTDCLQLCICVYYTRAAQRFYHFVCKRAGSFCKQNTNMSVSIVCFERRFHGVSSRRFPRMFERTIQKRACCNEFGFLSDPSKSNTFQRFVGRCAHGAPKQFDVSMMFATFAMGSVAETCFVRCSLRAHGYK